LDPEDFFGNFNITVQNSSQVLFISQHASLTAKSWYQKEES